MNESRPKLEDNLGRIVLFALLLACLFVLLPFVSALLWAGVLSLSSWPLYCRVLKVTGNRRTLASLLITFGMIVVVLLPFVMVGLTLADNVAQLKTAAQRVLDEGPPGPPAWVNKIPVVGKSAAERWQSLAKNSSELLQTAKRFLEPVGSWLLKGGFKLGVGLFDLALSILVTFFLLRNGPLVAEKLTAGIGRIAGERGQHLLKVAGETVRGVVYGILGTALVQALMAAAGLLAAGVPGVALLALLVFFLSVVPGGPPLVMFPATLWLFHQGETGWGIFMLIWSVAVSTIDNFVKPWLISQGSDMPLILIFFGVLGGALAFGFIGVFLGPTLLAVGWRLVAEWMSGVANKSPGKKTEATTAIE